MPRGGVVWWLVRPFGGVGCRGHVQCSAFTLGFSEVVVGFLAFLHLLSLICPNCTCMQLFSIPHSCFVFRCSKDTFVHVQLPKQRVPDLSQIPACLNETLLSRSNIKAQTPTIVSELQVSKWKKRKINPTSIK